MGSTPPFLSGEQGRMHSAVWRGVGAILKSEKFDTREGALGFYSSVRDGDKLVPKLEMLPLDFQATEARIQQLCDRLGWPVENHPLLAEIHHARPYAALFHRRSFEQALTSGRALDHFLMQDIRDTVRTRVPSLVASEISPDDPEWARLIERGTSAELLAFVFERMKFKNWTDVQVLATADRMGKSDFVNFLDWICLDCVPENVSFLPIPFLSSMLAFVALPQEALGSIKDMYSRYERVRNASAGIFQNLLSFRLLSTASAVQAEIGAEEFTERFVDELQRILLPRWVEIAGLRGETAQIWESVDTFGKTGYKLDFELFHRDFLATPCRVKMDLPEFPIPVLTTANKWQAISIQDQPSFHELQDSLELLFKEIYRQAAANHRAKWTEKLAGFHEVAGLIMHELGRYFLQRMNETGADEVAFSRLRHFARNAAAGTITPTAIKEFGDIVAALHQKAERTGGNFQHARSKVLWYFLLIANELKHIPVKSTTLAEAVEAWRSNLAKPEDRAAVQIMNPADPAWEAVFLFPEKFLEHTLEALLSNAIIHGKAGQPVRLTARWMDSSPDRQLDLMWENTALSEDLGRLRSWIAASRAHRLSKANFGLFMADWAAFRCLDTTMEVSVAADTCQVVTSLRIKGNVPPPSPIFFRLQEPQPGRQTFVRAL